MLVPPPVAPPVDPVEPVDPVDPVDGPVAGAVEVPVAASPVVAGGGAWVFLHPAIASAAAVVAAATNVKVRAIQALL
jgi:hypothetical protein